jgi:hypothetical protein
VKEALTEAERERSPELDWDTDALKLPVAQEELLELLLTAVLPEKEALPEAEAERGTELL